MDGRPQNCRIMIMNIVPNSGLDPVMDSLPAPVPGDGWFFLAKYEPRLDIKPSSPSLMKTLGTIMATKRRKLCEVMVSTVIIAVATVTLFWMYAIIKNWHGQVTPGRLLLGFVAGIVGGLFMMGAYIIPSAFLISLMIAYLKDWSLRNVVVILIAVATCSSVASY